MISDVTVELQVALSTHICLFSSVVLHDYVELLHTIELQRKFNWLKLIGQCWPLKFKW